MTKKFCMLVGFCLHFGFGVFCLFLCRGRVEIAIGHDGNILNCLYDIFCSREFELTEWAYGKINFYTSASGITLLHPYT